MKQLKLLKATAFLSLFFLLFSCVQLKGKLAVTSDTLISLKHRNLLLKKGSYDAKVNLKKKYVKVKYENDSTKGTFKLFFNQNIPTNDGDFIVKASQISQNFDLKGNLKTSITYGPKQSGRESCTYRERQTLCRVDSNGRRICWDEMVDVSGWRSVEYHNKFTRKDLKFDFVNSERSLANFDGNGTMTEKMYDFFGVCYRY